MSNRIEIAEALHTTRTERDSILLELAEGSPVLLVFLRHFGCAFCRQAISDVAEVRDRLARLGVQPVFVHMGPPEIARVTFAYYGIDDAERVCDPAATLYATFGLGKRSMYRQPFEWSVFKSLFLKGAFFKHGIGKVHGDGDQMHGVFFLRGSTIVRSFIHKSFADRPDYLRLVR